MSNNPNTIYVYVKGNKGKGAYYITNSQFEEIYSNKVDFNNVKDEGDDPGISDCEAMVEGLQYIQDNRGKGKIPDDPMSFIYTTFENNYHVASGLKEARSSFLKEFKKKIDILQKEFQTKTPQENKKIQFQFIPDDFKNKMLETKALLKNN